MLKSFHTIVLIFVPSRKRELNTKDFNSLISILLDQIAKTMAELMNSREMEESKSQVLRLKVDDASKNFKEEIAQQRYKH